MPQLPFHRAVLLLWVFLPLLFLTGCNTTKYLGEDELLLVENEIILTHAKEVKNKRNLNYELTTLYKQRPNKNWFFIPREWLHFKTNKPEHTSKFKKFLRRQSEPPAIFSDSLAQVTEMQMTSYLNYLGHFQARVNYEVIQRNKKARIRYYAEARELVLVDTIHFASSDSAIYRELLAISGETVFKRGVALEGSLYDSERERIARHMRNSGYAYFYSNAISAIDADTTESQRKAMLYLEVEPPFGETSHQQYSIGDITVFPQFDPATPDSLYRDTVVAGYLFKLKRPDFLVKPQTVLNGIHLEKGQIYSQEDYDRSIQHLSSLGVFRFVRIRLEQDSAQTDVLHLRIELTPNVKYEIGFDVEANYIDGFTLTGRGSLIGLSVNPRASNRNLFKGAELLVTNLSAGLEVNLSQIRTNAVWNSVELGFQNDLFIPKFADYLGLWKGLNRLPIGKKNLVSDSFYQTLQDKTSTRVTARYNYVFNFGFYETSLFNASFGYDIPRSANTRYVFDHIGIDYLRPITQPAFDTILSSNPFLLRSFGKQLFVSLFFREFNLTHRKRQNRLGESAFYGLNLELAGAEVWAVNAMYNAFALSQDTLRISGTDFSQYLRIEWDMRYNREYSPKRSLAARFNFGIARPFGFTTDVPYVKQFFAGGPNSIRGWAARGLGPGGYLDTLSTNLTNRLLFYQTGDLKLEASIEYRFEIYWRLKGALFLDAGNIWTLRPDPARCGSQFLLSPRISENCPEHTPRNDAFYKQIALGSGFGLRLDLTYFIIRMDLGVQLRNPRPVRNAMNPNPREWDYWENFRGWGMRDINFNFGLGYPF
ncbi:MAG: BamA/TamA family outer membrane protein [Saprospiraceae bacterium]|nr:BamA/TamA family outer membrane protein [Saprospiraceae bacterium]